MSDASEFSNSVPSSIPARRGNGFGVAGFVVGLIGLLLSLVPFAAIFLGVLLDILGIVFSAIGHSRARRDLLVPYSGLALAGLILSILGLCFVVLWLAVLHY
jgi:hypothetical protein